MSEEFGVSNPGLSWSETWIKALTQPSEAAYGEIAEDPGSSLRTAYTWVFVSSLIGYIFYNLVSGLLGTNYLIGEDLGGSLVLVLLCGAPLGAIFALLGLIINVGITQFIASALGGSGTYPNWYIQYLPITHP